MLILLLASFNGFRMVSCSFLAAFIVQSNRTAFVGECPRAAKCVPACRRIAPFTNKLRVTWCHSLQWIAPAGLKLLW